MTDPTGSTSVLAYDADGFLASVSSPAGTVVRINDAAGQLQSIVDPSGARTSFQYDGDGDLAALFDAENYPQAWVYDAAGDVTKATDKNGRASTYTYDGSGNLLSSKDRNGATTTYGYDGDSRVDKVTIPGSTTTIVNNAFGQPVSLANPDATVALAWTPGGQLSSETTRYTGSPIPDQTVTYTTDGDGQPTAISGQGSTTGFAYDAQGRLVTVDDSVAGTFGYTYDPGTGQVSTLTRPNGVTDHLSFDADARLTARDAIDASGDTLDLADYTYNTAGLRDTMTDTTGTHDYTYDADGRLTGVANPAGSGQADESFTYDDLGNRTSWNDNPAAQVKHGQADQLTQDATNAYGYDSEGNLTQQRNRATGATTNYSWNAAHELTKITNPDGSTVTYRYDPLGRRISTSDASGTTYDVWAGSNLRATLDGTGAVTNRSVFDPTTLDATLADTTPAGTTYPLVDGLGSTTATTDPAGQVTSRTSYSAYGTPTTTGTNPLAGLAGYTGTQQDPTSLDYNRARYYNPTTGTFLSQDPITAINPYRYAQDSPVSLSDPTGEIPGPVRMAVSGCFALTLTIAGFSVARTPEAQMRAAETYQECAEDIADSREKQEIEEEDQDFAAESAAEAEATGVELEPAISEEMALFFEQQEQISAQLNLAESIF